MARKWSNLNLPGALHFVTGNLIDRVPAFTHEATCLGFFEVFRDLLEKWPAKVIAYVLMPDHIHLIVNPRDGNIKGFSGALKSLSAKKIVQVSSDKRFVLETPDGDGSIHRVWQESFKAIPLWSGWMIWQKINYIHANPVMAGLVSSAKDYRWSSFRAFHFNSEEPLAVDHNWWWEDDSEKLSKAVKELGEWGRKNLYSKK
jgi:REP element-mobilizing transposase RayT